MIIYEITSALTTTILILIAPFVVGFTVKKPIPAWICWVVAVAIFFVFGILPIGNGTGNGIAGIFGSIGAVLFLYCGSRRKRKKAESTDKEIDNAKE